jgi:hypothetical protein
MPGHSRPKDGVASLAYNPGIHAELPIAQFPRAIPSHTAAWIAGIGERSDAVYERLLSGNDDLKTRISLSVGPGYANGTQVRGMTHDQRQFAFAA